MNDKKTNKTWFFRGVQGLEFAILFFTQYTGAKYII